MKAKTKTSRRPVKTLPVPSEFKMPNGAKLRDCICIYDRDAQKPAAKVPLSEREFEVLSSHHPQSGQPTMADYIADAIREKQRGPRGLGTLDELEFAKMQAITVLQLIADSVASHLTEDDTGLAGGVNYFAGIPDLIHQTQARLESAFTATHAAINGNAEVAS